MEESATAATVTAQDADPVLDQFLGDDTFPVEWRSEREK